METEITKKESISTSPDKSSTIAGVSVRGWIVVIIVLSVCGNWIANTLMVSLGYTSANMTVPEPIYSVFIAVISYYFGQLKK